MKLTLIFSFFIVLLISGCQKNEFIPDSDSDSSTDSFWLVDTNKMTGTTIIDVFPLVTRPVYAKIEEVDYSGLTDKVIVFKWDVFGTAIEGPRKGQQLQTTISYLAYWWAWSDIFDRFSFI